MRLTLPGRLALAAVLLAPLTPLAGCNSGGDDEVGPAESPLMLAKTSTKSGDGQDGEVEGVLPNPLRVIVTRDGLPVENVEVTWQAGNGGLMSPEVTISDVDGIAQSAWVLGPELGPQEASASVPDAEGSPVLFTAVAGEPIPPAIKVVQVLGPAGGNRFEPANLTVVVNELVQWEWPEGSLGHNVQPDDRNIPTGSGVPVDGPHTYQYTFKVPGTYRYYCQAHGAEGGVGMSGVVTVLAEAP